MKVTIVVTIFYCTENNYESKYSLTNKRMLFHLNIISMEILLVIIAHDEWSSKLCTGSIRFPAELFWIC